ncbi:thioredoxin family protein [Adhaeribacter terreus]|uniref:Thioredoxin family protein n=1 Tax=Adhaeribacter terreus TaxID=529703 RepID=A0ABW0E7N3_9BACT
MKAFSSVFVFLLLSLNVLAQSGYQLGQKVADFTLKDANGRQVSLHDFAGTKTVVLVFTNNLCPYSKLYENRLVSLNNTYQNRGVRFLFINPAIGAEDGETVADMAKKVSERNYTFPYLADEGQKISQQFGATKTPEVFVLHGAGKDFILKYKGAIDDNPQLESGVKDTYLRNAIEAVLNDRNVQAFDKRATGCLIKKY